MPEAIPLNFSINSSLVALNPSALQDDSVQPVVSLNVRPLAHTSIFTTLL